jgi:hypothetical protein
MGCNILGTTQKQQTFPLFSFRTNHRLLQSFPFARLLNRKPLTEKHTLLHMKKTLTKNLIKQIKN